MAEAFKRTAAVAAVAASTKHTSHLLLLAPCHTRVLMMIIIILFYFRSLYSSSSRILSFLGCCWMWDSYWMCLSMLLPHGHTVFTVYGCQLCLYVRCTSRAFAHSPVRPIHHTQYIWMDFFRFLLHLLLRITFVHFARYDAFCLHSLVARCPLKFIFPFFYFSWHR